MFNTDKIVLNISKIITHISKMMFNAAKIYSNKLVLSGVLKQTATKKNSINKRY